MEQRKYDRIPVEYSASFSGGWFGAQGVIVDLSVAGCRTRSAFAVKKDDCLGVLIDIPRYEHPLHVTLATVRWSNGQEFGMEFIQIERDDQRRLSELIRAIKGAGPRQTEDGDSSTPR
jgi:PilZ domain-containing protein